MSKVGIITFLHNRNYGSSLQAYALQRVIREMGHDVLHINYRPDSTEKLKNLLESGNSPKRILEGFRKRKVSAGHAGNRAKGEAIPRFYEKHMKIGSVCANGKALAANGKDMDILICGSDQIWNPSWLNPAYFLTFGRENQRKIAYAASMGVRELRSERKRDMIRKWTRDFAGISLREDAGADLMTEITGKRPAVMPDPVCLLTAEQWREIAVMPEIPGGYVLCYFIGENPAYWEKARATATEKQLPMVILPVTDESYEQGEIMLDGAGPEVFVGAVDGAAVLCTDSFHGLAFATILGTECRLIRRDNDNDPENRNSRVDTFLKRTAEEGIEAMREKGMDWLKRQLF